MIAELFKCSRGGVELWIDDEHISDHSTFEPSESDKILFQMVLDSAIAHSFKLGQQDIVNKAHKLFEVKHD